MNNYFSFKQFTVWQERTAMKVGTDGVLLGVLAAAPQYSVNAPSTFERILDIGTGTGLVALILAQRFPTALIDAIDIESDATLQASDNFAKSPWPDRLNATCRDVTTLSATHGYDLIVCNPPYFNNSLKCPDNQRSVARHTDTLSYADLASAVVRLLNPNGRFVVILPTDSFDAFLTVARPLGLQCTSKTDIFPTPTKASKRIVAELILSTSDICTQNFSLVIEEARHVYTPDFKSLTLDFYLDRK